MIKKIFIYSLLVFALILIIFNATKLNFDALMEGDSGTALITMAASACVMVLLAILLVSLQIEKKVR